MGDYEGITYSEKPNYKRKGGQVPSNHGSHLGRFIGYCFDKPYSALPGGFVCMAASKGKKILFRAYFNSMWDYSLYSIFDSLVKCLAEKPVPQPQGYIHQGNQNRDLYQRTNHRSKSFPGIDAENSHRHCNGQLKIIAGCSKGNGGCFGIICTDPFSHKKGNQEHHNKIDHQRYGNSDNIQRDLHNIFAFQGEHHKDGKKQGDQGQGTDLRNEFSWYHSLFLP